MTLFAISDLHLAISVDKPMDIFGSRWDNYMDRIRENWLQLVGEQDYVLVPGDISWAMYLEQAYEDFRYINGLPGIKVISKGNHDYWWETTTKLKNYTEKNGFKKILFLHNNSILYKDIALCGTRGWICPNPDEFTKQDEKIYQRELQRLELSIQQGLCSRPKEIFVVLHYPPVNKYKDMTSGFVKILKKYGVKKCIYGHLHGEAHNNALVGEYQGIEFYLAACDFLDFKPLKIVE